jgi:hypothetical protein
MHSSGTRRLPHSSWGHTDRPSAACGYAEPPGAWQPHTARVVDIAPPLAIWISVGQRQPTCSPHVVLAVEPVVVVLCASGSMSA